MNHLFSISLLKYYQDLLILHRYFSVGGAYQKG